MLDAAIARPERDQPGVLGVGERHPRLGDAGQAGSGGMALEHVRGLDRREIAAPRQQRRLGGADAHDQRRRQQRRELGQGDRGQAPRPWRRPARDRTRAARHRARRRDRPDCGSPMPASRARPRSSSRPTDPRAARGRAPPPAGASARHAARRPRPRAAGADFPRSPARRRSPSTFSRSSRISTGSPRRNAVIASPRSWPALASSPRRGHGRGVEMILNSGTRFSLPSAASYGAAAPCQQTYSHWRSADVAAAPLPTAKYGDRSAPPSAPDASRAARLVAVVNRRRLAEQRYRLTRSARDGDEQGRTRPIITGSQVGPTASARPCWSCRPAGRIMRAGRKILIVDDDAALRQSLAEQLRAQRRVHWRSNATPRRRRSKSPSSERFDAILLDVGLPDMDGRELCRLLRRTRRSRADHDADRRRTATPTPSSASIRAPTTT